MEEKAKKREAKYSRIETNKNVAKDFFEESNIKNREIEEYKNMESNRNNVVWMEIEEDGNGFETNNFNTHISGPPVEKQPVMSTPFDDMAE